MEYYIYRMKRMIRDGIWTFPIIMFRYHRLRRLAYLRNVSLIWISPAAAKCIHPVGINLKTQSRIDLLSSLQNKELSFAECQIIIPSNKPITIAKYKEELVIMNGHGRLFAAERAGIDRIEVLYYDLDKPANYWDDTGKEQAC